jgi:HK97 family phage major capsid protein
MSEVVKQLEGISELIHASQESSAKALEEIRAENAELKGRLEAVEAGTTRPAKSGAASTTKLQHAIEKFYRKGDRSELEQFAGVPHDEKSMSIGVPAAGGYTHVPELADQILAAIGEAVPIFADVGKQSTDANEFRQIFTVNAPTASRSAEGGTRNATETPRLARVDVPLFDLYAYASVTNELLDSSQFNVAEYLGGEVQRQFEASIESEIIGGTGSDQALGILTQATSAVVDGASPERAFTLYQYLDLGIMSPKSTFDYDGLVDLVAALPVRYRRGAKFYASTSAVQTMRKFRDVSDGMPLWRDASGGVAGAPQSILGYEVVEVPGLPVVTGAAKPVLFGNLGQAYLWVTHSRGMRVIRDEVTAPGSTKFYFSLQCGGKPADTRALKALRVS